MPSAADQNVDHRALYLFARVALWDLAAEGEGLGGEAARLAYPVHYPRWPSPRGLRTAPRFAKLIRMRCTKRFPRLFPAHARFT